MIIRNITDPGGIAPLWKQCESGAACSFFQSWAWNAEFLRIADGSAPLSLLEIWLHGEIAGIALLASRKVRRHGLVNSRTIFLNQAGDTHLDQVTVEHSGVLARKGHELQCTRAFLAYLDEHRHEWDEAVIAGISSGLDAYLHAAPPGAATMICDTKPYYLVDLDNTRNTGSEYLDLLSSNTRYQIRRASRAYSWHGALELHAAEDQRQATQYLNSLIELHQAYWTRRGLPGAFSNDAFTNFHRELIDRNFESGCIQLLRIAAGNRVIGYLYNFAYRDRVYSYQSGFEYGGKHEKPGLVSHHQAIEYNLRQGMKIYDFLAGESQYKQSLCTSRDTMAWITYRQARLQFTLENIARRSRSALINIMNRPGR